MGLLMSDTMLIDPTLDDATWLRESLGDWAYEQDAARDAAEHEATRPTRRMPHPLIAVMAAS
jgi:hypothetical protein